MPTLTTDITLMCPRDKKKVDAKIDCEGPPRCIHFEHYAHRGGNRVYVVCSFGEPPRREECILRDPPDPELDQMEEETTEIE